MKLLNSLCLIVSFIGIYVKSVLSQTLDIPRLNNQKEVYPNQFEAATNETNLEKANYTSPYMSHVLFEEDPKRKLRKTDFVNELRFQAYRLTKGEAEQIFSFVDADRDDLVDQNEWDTFSGLYIFPFEACDHNHDYLLDEAEFAYCFDKDPRSQFIVFRRKEYEKRHEKMLWTVTSRARPLINFHDYMFIRRALFAWKNCQSNAKFISKSAFKCAMRTAILQKAHFNVDLEQIYDTGVELANDFNIIQLDFINYLQSLYCVYLFSTFGQPIHMPYIEKTSWIKAIREDRLPHNYEESEVNYLYELINTNPLIPVTQMNYQSFAFFWNAHRLFNKYSQERPLLLTKNELVSLVQDQWFPQKIAYSLDNARTNFTIAQYQEASLVLQRKRPNEGHYFFSFKQDASENTAALWNETTVNGSYYNITKNTTNYEFYFSIFSEFDKNVWTKNNFYRALQLANLYVSLVPDWKFVISSTYFVDKLMDQYSLVNPPVSYVQRQNYPIYKHFPREIYIDILVFSTIENYRNKISSIMKSTYTNIYESSAKYVLMDFGMRQMPDTVLDLAKKGFDNLRRRTYDPIELLKNCVIVQAVAADHLRSKEFEKKYNIVSNEEYSRRFPTFPRRAQASPHV